MFKDAQSLIHPGYTPNRDNANYENASKLSLANDGNYREMRYFTPWWGIRVYSYTVSR